MALARDCMASVPEATYRATMLALMGFDQRDALKNIAVPTLVLSGSKDKNAPASMMARMATYIPLAKYVEFNAGHLVNLERPAAFNAALDQFLKGQSSCKAGDGMMTVQASKSAAAVDEIVLDAPIFDPAAFRLNGEQAEIIARARQLGKACSQAALRPTIAMRNFRPQNLSRPAPRGAARNRHPEEAPRSRRRLPDLCSGCRRDRPVLRGHCADMEHARLLNAMVRAAGRRP